MNLLLGLSKIPRSPRSEVQPFLPAYGLSTVAEAVSNSFDSGTQGQRSLTLFFPFRAVKHLLQPFLSFPTLFSLAKWHRFLFNL